MKFLFIFLILFFVIGGTVFLGSTNTLPGVINPKMISIFADELFVTEDDAIYVYSLKDLSLKVKFGKKGAGPTEFQVWPFQSIWIKVFPDYIIVNSFDKVLYFSKDGKFIKEIKKNYLTTQITPIGENFVGVGSRTDAKDKIRYVTVNLYDAKLQRIKELYCQPFPQQGINLDLITDFLHFKVYDDTIFIEESPRGFLIEIFDKEGNKQYEINKQYVKIPVNQRDKEAAIEEFKAEPTIKSIGWEAYKKMTNFQFRNDFPPIKHMEIDNKKIYIRTFKTKDDKDEYIVLNLKGDILGTIYLPHMEQSPFWHNILDIKLFTITNDKFYYLKENKDEEWELYREEIKY